MTRNGQKMCSRLIVILILIGLFYISIIIITAVSKIEETDWTPVLMCSTNLIPNDRERLGQSVWHVRASLWLGFGSPAPLRV